MDNIRLACAVCRIMFSRLCRRVKGETPEKPKPVKSVVAIGLTHSGKSTALALMAGEPLSDVEPTKGFHIKDLKLPSCYLTVKELGGSEKIRKYWVNYYNEQDGVIYFVNGCGADDELELAQKVMKEALDHPKLIELPVLLVVTHQDQETCLSPAELSSRWHLKETYGMRVKLGGSSIRDVTDLSAALESFADSVLDSTSPIQIIIEEAN